MAKFEELKANFLDMDFDERMEFILRYTEKRGEAIEKKTVVMTKVSKGKRATGSKKNDKTIAVTPEQLQLLQSLGLV
jgi:hypothetical protein